MKHSWEKQTEFIDLCTKCQCLRQRRFNKQQPWKSKIVYVMGTNTYTEAPKCINPDDATLSLF